MPGPFNRRPGGRREDPPSAPKPAGVIVSNAMLCAVRNLAVDRMTAEVTDALAEAGIRTILLKGPAIVRWLYDDAEVRPYGDCDLLVAPDAVDAAERVLERCGFRPAPLDGLPDDVPRHAREWLRPGAMVDLHQTLAGAEVEAGTLWDVLSQLTESMRVGGAEVEVLRPPARTVALMLHVAKDGARVEKVRRDLSHALARLPISLWQEAALLAGQINATGAFATGLRLVPAGAALADRLGLGVRRPVVVALRARARGSPPLAVGLDWLTRERSWRRRIMVVAHKLIPPPAYLRALSPLARRGTLGLALAYVLRPFGVLWQLGPALWALYRARREYRKSRGA
jgi:hypothetical protein